MFSDLSRPNGDLLVKDLTFEVKSGQNVLVCGPNGCGSYFLLRQLFSSIKISYKMFFFHQAKAAFSVFWANCGLAGVEKSPNLHVANSSIYLSVLT